MSSKASFSIGGLKSVAGRTKQKMLQKMGKVDETVDIAFNQEFEKLMVQKKMMKKMIKNIREYGKALRMISTSHTVLGEGVATFYEPTNPLYQVNLKNQQIIFEVDACRQNLEDALDADIVVPMTAYIGQYNEVIKRCKERARRLTDMDRFKNEVRDLTLHPSEKHPDKLPKAQRNFALAKAAFEELNGELMRDIPILYSDRLVFFDPCFATLIAAQAMYYATANNLFGDVSAQLSHIDRTAVHRHARVITEVSAASKKVFSKDDDVVEAATSQYQAYNTHSAVALNTPPPSTGGPYGGRPPMQQQQQQQQFNNPGYGGAPPQHNNAPGGYGGAPPQHNNAPGGFGGAPPQASGGFGAPPAQGAASGRALPSPGGRPTIPGRPSNPPAVVRQPQARALYPFQAGSPQELSFNPGDMLIVHKQAGDWWEAESNGKRGLIPANYVQLV